MKWNYIKIIEGIWSSSTIIIYLHKNIATESAMRGVSFVPVCDLSSGVTGNFDKSALQCYFVIYK